MAALPEDLELSDRVRTPEPRILRLATDTSRQEKVPVCIYGRMYGTHEAHLAYMNGQWIEKPVHLDHRAQGKIETCPQCEEKYQQAIPEEARNIQRAKIGDSRGWAFLKLDAYRPA